MRCSCGQARLPMDEIAGKGVMAVWVWFRFRNGGSLLPNPKAGVFPIYNARSWSTIPADPQSWKCWVGSSDARFNTSTLCNGFVCLFIYLLNDLIVIEMPSLIDANSPFFTMGAFSVS